MLIYYLLSVVLLYLSLVCLFGGFTWRLYLWNQTGLSAMRLGYFPKPRKQIRPIRIFADTVFFTQLTKINPVFWFMVILFHISLLLVFTGHLLLLIPFPGMLESEFNNHTNLFGLVVGTIWAITVVYMLLRRFTQPIKQLSEFGDYFILCILLGVIISGISVRWCGNLTYYRIFAHNITHPHALITVLASSPRIFSVHIILASVLFIYCPFSKLVHVIGTFLTNTIRRK